MTSRTPTKMPSNIPSATPYEIAEKLCIRRGRYCIDESLGGRSTLINILATLCQYYILL